MPSAGTGRPSRPGKPGPGCRDAALILIRRQVLLRYLNVVRFLVQRSGGTGAASPAGDNPGQPVLDRWLLSESQIFAGQRHVRPHAFRCDIAARRLAATIEDLSCWYLPLSRASLSGPAALSALANCLDVITRLMAPFAPFLADRAWRLIGESQGIKPADSVHLEPWPEVLPQLIDHNLGRQMRLARRLVRSGRAAREAALVPARQPLRLAWLSAGSYSALDAELRALVAAELNVRSFEPGSHEDFRVILDLSGSCEAWRRA